MFPKITIKKIKIKTKKIKHNGKVDTKTIILNHKKEVPYQSPFINKSIFFSRLARACICEGFWLLVSPSRVCAL